MPDKNIEQEFGLQVLLDGKPFIHYTSLTINRGIDNFVDTFSMTVSNPGGRYSTTIPVGCVISVIFTNVEIFRGIVEKKNTSWKNIGSTMMLSGREELVLLTEDDADPSVGPFKNSTDNYIITLMCQGRPWKLELGKPANIKEYAISSGSVRKAQIIDDVVKYNDYVIIKKGTTIYKKKIPTEKTTEPSVKFTMTVLDGALSIHNSRIISIEVNEDITSIRSKLIGYTYQSGKKKMKANKTLDNTDLSAGDYAKRIRNQSSLSGEAINRTRYLTTPAKDAGEMQTQLKRLLRDSDINAEISIVVSGIFDIDILDVVDVRIEQEKILQYMYVSSIDYSLNSNNMATTTVKVKPFPKV